ncbi:NAD-dependent epimerase/dehydratase family protein [Clostridium sp. MCC353]|uniref:NAD-dependent epimerase/dehydratase family protein n=1 Tax=Clostridium sp. MCC353 TaxID=2592646 RepID=UPI001C03961C|nr:NAD-dependent epimerase/dehydratase family protein [Clostridium sp. MCC353]MBT9779501.1 NAD-dependent epimerase/dehydratase family protein [Clostridium sp. MCC353]
MFKGVVDRYLLEDLEILANSNLPYELLTDSTVFITGATGLIGVQLIRALLMFNSKKNTRIKIIALVRNKNKAIEIFGSSIRNIIIVEGDVTTPIFYRGSVDYIIHCASVTSSRTMIKQPVETLYTSIEGTRNTLEFACKKHVKSFIYVSSMEMYGSFTQLNHDVYENTLGYVDPLNVRSNYPEGKRICENMCVAYLNEYGVPIKIARLAQTFGAGVLKEENRVFAQFARSVIKGEDIVLHTNGISEGNYCYTRDTVKALFLLLVKGVYGEAYNISNPETHTTIAEMARMVCEKIADNRIKVVFDIPKSNIFGYAADTKMKLNSDKMQALGWKPEVGLEEAFRRLIGSLKDTYNY